MHHMLKLLAQKCFNLYQLSLDHFIAPPFCAYCKDFLSSRRIFCTDCYQLIAPIVSVQLQITKTHSMQVMAISDYQEPLKSLILSKTWGDIVACDQLAQLIWQMTYFKHMPCDYLVPIPLHWMRYAKRGYNQSQEIAKVLGKFKNVPVAPIITRAKHTAFQSSLAHDKRLENIKDAFALKDPDTEKFSDKHIVLVDDLMTTGATLVAAAKVLLPLKPASINAIVVCRVV